MSWNHKFYPLLMAGALASSSAPARAESKDCLGYASLKDKPLVETAKITSADKKTFFVKGETENKACPAATSACLRKAFLVPGNAVLVSGATGAFACVTYVNAKGVETNGWVPDAAITRDQAGPNPKPEDWAGTWIRDEAKIAIKADGRGGLAINGDATYGAHDPDRVKRGAVNLGEISGAPHPAGARLGFTMGDEGKTLPVEKGDDGMCKVWMQRVGDYLLVDDNNACGGMNVSFRGTYVRR